MNQALQNAGEICMKVRGLEESIKMLQTVEDELKILKYYRGAGLAGKQPPLGLFEILPMLPKIKEAIAAIEENVSTIEDVRNQRDFLAAKAAKKKRIRTQTYR